MNLWNLAFSIGTSQQRTCEASLESAGKASNHSNEIKKFVEESVTAHLDKVLGEADDSQKEAVEKTCKAIKLAMRHIVVVPGALGMSVKFETGALRHLKLGSSSMIALNLDRELNDYIKKLG